MSVAETTQVPGKADSKVRQRDYKALGRLGGRPRKVNTLAAADNSEAFETAKKEVAVVTLDLAERVRETLREAKKTKDYGVVNQLSTPFGIWFDKLHKLQAGVADTEINIPTTMALKLSAKLANNNTSQSLVLSKPCADQVEPPVSLAGQDLDGLIGL